MPGPPAGTASRDRFVAYISRGQMVVAKWPKKRRKATPAELEQQNEFKRLVMYQKLIPAGQRRAATEIAQNSKYTWRDVMALAMTGRLIDADNYGDIAVQYNLNILTETPGAMVFRGQEEWQGLEPGAAGYVLTMVDGQPAWTKFIVPGGSGIVSCLCGLSGPKSIAALTNVLIDNLSLAGGYDEAGMFNASTPDRISVVEGYNYARYTMGVTGSADTVRKQLWGTKTPGGSGLGMAMERQEGSPSTVTSAWIPVNPGDYFQMWVRSNSSFSMSNAGTSFFQLELRQ